MCEPRAGPNHVLQCSCADEVVLVLRSSDRIAHDICNAFDHCPDPSAPPVGYVVALRKWQSLRPESEFRCFVRDNKLVGISQRDVSQHFPQLVGCEGDIKHLLETFFEEHIQGVFPLSNYSMDTYITAKGKVRLLDFNPIGGTTSPLLFDWEELSYPALNGSNVQETNCLQGDSGARDVSRDYGNPPGGCTIRTVRNSHGLMLGAKMACAMPYDLTGCSVEEMVNAMKKLTSGE